MQVYTKLLVQGIYLGSLSTFYRVLEENRMVKERRAGWLNIRPGMRTDTGVLAATSTPAF